MSQETKTGKKKALVIAVSDYLNLPPESQLPYCKTDGEAMDSTLADLGYEITAKRIGTINGEEFKDAIIDFFRDERLNTKDTLLFYFSGHGILDGRGGKYFGTTDISPNIPERKGTTFNFLMEQMENSISQKTIAVLDCCYSGDAHPNVVGKAGVDRDIEAEKLGRDALEMFKESKGICVLASSLSNKRSYFIEDKKMSTYTYYVIEGLKKNNDSVDKDGNVTPVTLEKYVFSQMLKCDKNLQRPVTNLSISGDIVLAHHEELRKQQEREISEMRKKIEEDFHKLDEMRRKGFKLASKGKYKEAISWYDKALQIDPKDAVALYSKGFALYYLDKCEDAILCYDMALETDPKYPDALSNKGLALDYLGKYEEAISYYDMALQIDSKHVNALSNKAYALFFLGKYEEAISYYDMALETDPKHFDALNGKGLAFSHVGKYEEAISWYDKALKIDPESVDALYSKGRDLFNLGKYEEARSCFDMVLEIDPKHVYALTSQGRALYNRGRPEEAIAWYDKVLEIDPKNVGALCNKGNTVLNLNKNEEAMSCFDKVLEIDPKNVGALIGKGDTLFHLGKYEEAISYYDMALQIDPKDALALYNKSCSKSHIGKIDEAIDLLEKAIASDTRFKDLARKDNDFLNIRNNSKFQLLIK